MVKKNCSDIAVQLGHTECLRELAQRKNLHWNVLHHPTANRNGVDASILHGCVLSSGECPLHGAELRDAELFGKLRIQAEFGAASINKEDDLLASVQAHLDQGQGIAL